MGRIKTVLLIAVLLILAVVLFFALREPRNPSTEHPHKNQQGQEFEPRFRPDGTLIFTTSEGILLSRITIEIADNESEQSQGLMYRRSMADSCGMLFVFGAEEPRSFWMKNTHIPLDIIFADEGFRILNIVSGTVPFSEAPVPSSGPARYVVEVNAGYTAKYNIKPGCKISYQLIALP